MKLTKHDKETIMQGIELALKGLPTEGNISGKRKVKIKCEDMIVSKEVIINIEYNI